MEDDDPALAGEADDSPGGQETADIHAVLDRLTPSVLVEDVDADPADPDDEDGHQRDVVDHREEGQVATGALAAQAGSGDVDKERDCVADNTDQYDDRKDVGVQYRDDSVQFVAIGVVFLVVGERLVVEGQSL